MNTYRFSMNFFTRRDTMRKTKLFSCLLILLAVCCVLTSCDFDLGALLGSTAEPGTTDAPQDGSTGSSNKPNVTNKPNGSSNNNNNDNNNNKPSGGTTKPSGTTIPELPPEQMPHNEDLLLGGVNISSYKIVYGHSRVEDSVHINATTGKEFKSNTGKSIWDDLMNSTGFGPYLLGENKESDFDHESALRLQALIEKEFGYTLPVVKDTDAPQVSRYEILVGKTNREASLRLLGTATPIDTTDDMKLDQYYIGFNTTVEALSSQYLICGGCYGATWHAIDELEEYFSTVKAAPIGDQDDDAPVATAVDIADLGNVTSAYDFYAVACLGDSITRGSQGFPDANSYGTKDGFAQKIAGAATATYLEQFLSYPAVLQRLIWKDYLIINYGQGYSSIYDYQVDVFEETAGPFYYNDYKKFRINCLTESNREDFEFDVILYMLGTNDAGRTIGSFKGAANWGGHIKQTMYEEVKLVLEQILEGSPNAKFVFMNAPHRCDGHADDKGATTAQKTSMANDAAMRELQKEIATRLKRDDGYDVYHYDMGRYTAENLSATGECGTTYEDELAAHQDYYNILTDTGTPDTTHPNFRGYAKIAEGMADLLAYVCEGAAAPQYMIDID